MSSWSRRLIGARSGLRWTNNLADVEGVPAHESDHFMTCPECGQALDMRELWQALHHDTPGHRPVALDA